MKRRPRVDPPAVMMVWSVTDDVIEKPDELERQFSDIRSAGFGGVAAFVRCSRYAWNHPAALETVSRINRLCRAHGLACWLGPDPRFVSRTLIEGHHGLEVAHCGDRPRAETAPNRARVRDGCYAVRCILSPRHSHMFHEVAVEFSPLALIRVLAVRDGGPAERNGIVDLTSTARFFYNARDRYVEAFGTFSPRDPDSWSVVALFGTGSSHADFSDKNQMDRYCSELARLKKAGARPDGLMWDEPGFTCTYGSYPWSATIRNSYRSASGRDLEDEAAKLLFDQKDNSHVAVRVAYFRAVQEGVQVAQRKTLKEAQRLWGRGIQTGIHDTWHFESADMCDMNHGSLDLWAALSSKTGGFVDVGGVQELSDPGAPLYDNLAAMSVIASSLGKLSSGKFAYNNLWTVGHDNGHGTQILAMDHCVDVMALFGTRWLAHCYGPVGTIGEEWTFLGSPFLPGYPGHATWSSFPRWIQRLSGHLEETRGRLPVSRLLVVYPVETMYALGDRRADDLAKKVFRLVRLLLDGHHHVDVVSPAGLARARWGKDGLEVSASRYRAVLFPHPDVIPREFVSFLRRGASRVCCVGSAPGVTEHGARIRDGRWQVAADVADAVRWADLREGLRPVDVPDGTWVTMTPREDGKLVTLVPARAGLEYGGEVVLEGRELSVPRNTRGLTRILFPQAGPPRLLGRH